MSNINEHEQQHQMPGSENKTEENPNQNKLEGLQQEPQAKMNEQPQQPGGLIQPEATPGETPPSGEVRPVERSKAPARSGARGTAAMDPQTRKEVARKGGLAVSRNKQHMAEIGRKGGQSVSKNREHMAQIGRKGGAASRGHR